MNSILYIDDENLNTFMFKKLFEKNTKLSLQIQDKMGLIF